MEINIGVAEELANMGQKILIMMSTGRALTILGLGVLTFKFLDLFLETNIVIARKKVESFKTRALMWAMMLIVGTLTPVIIIVVRMIKGDFRGSNALVLLIVSAISCLVFGIFLKRYLPEDDPRRKQWILLLEAFNVAIEVIAENIAYWIQAIVIRIINVVLDILRGPFVMYYLLVSTILNLALSFSITGFMGASQSAGEVNIIGSLIGGAAHAFVRRHKIAELKAEFEKREVKSNEETI